MILMIKYLIRKKSAELYKIEKNSTGHILAISIAYVTMKTLPFTKMHGLGNSYIYFDAISHPFDLNTLGDLSRFVSSSATGIGSDGLILICPSKKADIKMRIFNKDGSEAKNCGNGLRCVAAYAYNNRIVKQSIMTIETLGGVVTAQIIKNDPNETWISVNMGRPKLERQQIPMLGAPSTTVVAEPFQIEDTQLLITAVSMGNPHAVFFVSDEPQNHYLHLTLGPKIEKDSRFPEAVNVEFVTRENAHSFRCRVWERGSGATQACGTGACAVAAAAILNGLASYDTDIQIQLDGGSLLIKWNQNGDLWMTGPAQVIASGSFYIYA